MATFEQESVANCNAINKKAKGKKVVLDKEKLNEAIITSDSIRSVKTKKIKQPDSALFVPNTYKNTT